MSAPYVNVGKGGYRPQSVGASPFAGLGKGAGTALQAGVVVFCFVGVVALAIASGIVLSDHANRVTNLEHAFVATGENHTGTCTWQINGANAVANSNFSVQLYTNAATSQSYGVLRLEAPATPVLMEAPSGNAYTILINTFAPTLETLGGPSTGVISQANVDRFYTSVACTEEHECEVLNTVTRGTNSLTFTISITSNDLVNATLTLTSALLLSFPVG